MRVLVEMVDPIGVEARRAPDDAVNDVVLGQEQLGKIATVLARDSRDERAPRVVGHDRLPAARQSYQVGPGATLAPWRPT